MANQWKRQRLKHWDYSRNGLYFVTICTFPRRELFGRVLYDEGSATIETTPLGDACIRAARYIQDNDPSIVFDAIIVMPDHLHLLVGLNGPSGRAGTSLSAVIARIKRMVTREAKRQGMGQSLWQRSFYDHVVRDEVDAARIREYMENNPLAWALGEHDIQGEIDSTVWQ